MYNPRGQQNEYHRMREQDSEAVIPSDVKLTNNITVIGR